MREELLTIQQAADMLGVSTKTLRRWEARGVLVPERTVGNQRRYTLSELQAFKQKGKKTYSGDDTNEVLTPAAQTSPTQTTTAFPTSPVMSQPITHQPSVPVSAAAPVQDQISNVKERIELLHTMENKKRFIPAKQLTIAGILLVLAIIATFSVAGANLFNSSSETNETKRGAQNGVLAARSKGKSLFGDISFNIPAIFNAKVTINKDFVVNGKSLFNEDIKVNNKNVDLGTGRLTASNVVYGLTAGANITITGDPQRPTISTAGGTTSIEGQSGALTLGDGISLTGLEITNTGVLSLGGQTGDVELTAGDGISISGTEITNNDPGSAQNIFKTVLVGADSILADSNDDTLEFVAGSGITITPDTTAKTITISSGTSSQWSTTGSDIYYDTGNVGVGNNSPGRTLDVTGTARVTGGVTFSAFGAGILHTDSSGVLSSSAVNLAGGSSEVTGALPVGNGGTGVTGTPTNGQVLIGNGSGFTLATISAGSGIGIGNGGGTISVTNNGVLSLAGTANQVNVSGATGNITLSLPQNIHTAATPTFASMSLTANTNQLVLGTGTTGTITMASLTNGRTYTLPDASGEFCLTSGNCSGSGGSLTGAGTTNFIAKFTSATGLSDSSIFDNGKVGIGTASPQGLFNVSGGPAGQALVVLNYTGAGQNILVGSSSGTTRFVFDESGNLNLVTGAYQIGGNTVLSGTTLGAGVTSSSLTSVGALNSGSITSGFGSIDTGSDDISGGNITATGATGLTVSGNGAGLTFSGSGNHDITASSGTLRFGATTLNGAITGNSQNITGLGNLSAGGTITFGGFSSNGGILFTNGSGQVGQVTAGSATQVLHGGTSPSFGAVALGTDVSGTLPVTSGGTGITTVATGDLLYASGADTLARRAIGNAGQILTVSGGVPVWADAGGTLNFWQRGSGAVAPLTISDDLLVGGASTASAKFQIVGTTGNATTSGNLTFNSAATVQSTNNQTLTFGGNSTGNIVFSPLNGSGILTVNGNLTLANGKTYQINGTDVLSANTLGSGVTTSSLTTVGALASGSIANGFGTISTGNTITGTTLNGTTGINTGAAGGTQRIDNSGNLVNIGTIGSTYLSTSTNVVNLAASTALQLNGTTVIDASRNLSNIAGVSTSLTPTAANTYALGTGTGNQYSTIYGQSIYQNGNQVCDTGGNCSGQSVNYWDQNNGALSTKNTTVDLLVGGISTASAKFAVLNINSGTPTASISANSGNNSLYITGNGTLATTNAQTLTVGGSSTGNVIIDAGSGLITLSDNTTVGGNLNLTSGNAFQINGTSVLSNNTLGTGVLASSLTSVGALNAGSITSGFGAIDTGTDSISGGDITATGTTGFTASGNGAGLTFSGSGNHDITASSGTLRIGAATLLGAITGNGQNITGLGNISQSGAATLSTGTGLTTVGGNLTVNGTGITYANNTTLTLGTSTTALNIASNLLNLDTTNNRVGIGTNAPTGKLQVEGANTGKALAILNETGNQNILSASASGSPVFNITRSGTLELLESSGNTYFGTIAVGDLTANQTYTFPDATGTICLSTGNCAGGAGGSKWQLNGSVLAPLTATNQVVLGGNTTSNFQFEVNGARTGKALVSLNETGNQNILTASASGSTVFNLTRSGTLQLLESAGNTYFGTLSVGDLAGDKTYVLPNFGGNSATICLDTGNCAGAGGGISGSGTAGQLAFFDGNGSITSETSGFSWDATNNRLGIGTDTPLGTVDVRAQSGTLPIASISGQTAAAGVIVDQSGTGDLFTASKSGATKFVITNAGDLRLAGNQTIDTLTNGTLGIGTTNATTLTIGRSGQGITLPGFDCSAFGNGGKLTTTAGGVLTCSNDNGGGAGSNWDVINGAISPKFASTLDLLLGSNATASAKFGLLNVNSGTPTASISANSGDNALFLTGAGNLGTTNSQSLTIGGASTGNIILSPLNGAGTVTVNGNINLASGKVFQINGASVLSNNTLGSGVTNSSLQTVGTISSGTWQGTAIAPQYGGTGDNTSGTTGVPFIAAGDWQYEAQLSSSRGGTGADLSGAAQGAVPYFSSAGVMSALAPGTSGYVLTTNGAGQNPSWTDPATIGTNYWDRANGVLSPKIASVQDLLLGSNATSSAKIGFINVNSGTPTATISANSGNNASFLTGAGNLGTTNGQTLTVGGASTGNIIIDSGSGAINLADATTLTGNFTQTGATTFTTGTGLTTVGGNLTVNGTGITLANNSTLTLGNSTTALNIASNLINADTTNARVGIGTNAPVGKVDVQGANTGKALVILNETGNQDILTGSASGTTRFTFDRSGNLNLNGGGYQIGGTTVIDSSRNLTNIGTIGSTYLSTSTNTVNLAASTDLQFNGTTVINASRQLQNVAGVTTSLTPTAANTYSLGTGTGNQYQNIYGQAIYQNGNQVCDASGNCAGQSVNYWDQNNGALSAKNTTVDLLVGGTSTSSAKFAVLNVNPNASGVPTASVSAGTAGASYLTANGNLQTTAFQTLTLGGSSTGGIVLDSGNGSAISLLDATTLAGSFTQSGNNTFTTGTGQVTLNGNVDATNGLDVTNANLTVGGSNAIITTAGAFTGTALTIDNLSLDGNTFSTSTGDITIDANGDDIVSADRLTIGSATPGVGQFNVTGAATGKALAILNETGGQAIFTASSSGTTRFTIANNGQITASAYGSGIAHFSPTGLISSGAVDLASSDITGTLGAGNGGTGFSSYSTGDLLVGNGSSTLSKLTVGGEGSVLTVQSGTPTWVSSSSINYWQRALGAIAPLNLTDDLLLGSSATSSAKFAFTNVAGGTPTASISANSGANSTYLTGTGNLGTTNAQTLTLGGASTGNLVLDSGSGLISLLDATTLAGSFTQSGNNTFTTGTGQVTLNGNVDATNGLDVTNANLTVGGAAFTVDTTGAITSSKVGNALTLSGAGATIAFSGNGLAQITTASNNHLALMPNGTGNVGINTTSPLATLDVRGNVGTNSIASVSGETSKAAFVVDNTGVGDLFTASKSGATKFTILNNGNIQLNNYTTAGGLLYTTSTGTVAQLGAGNLGQCLTSNGTGNAPSYTNCAAGINYWQSVNPGTITPYNTSVATLFGGVSTASASLQIYGATALQGTSPVASISGNTSQSAFIIDNKGSGDLFTASSSGLPRFVIQNSGNIIGYGNFTLDQTNNGSTNGFLVKNNSGTASLTVDTTANRVIVGASSGCTGRLCVNQSITGPGGASTASNMYNLQSINISSGTPTYIGQNILLTDTSSAVSTTLEPLVLDTSGTTNTAATINSIIAKIPASATGTFMELQNGSTDILNIANSGAGVYRSLSNTLPIASFSALTNFAGLVVDNSKGDIFTASASGNTRFAINNNGNIQLSGGTNFLTTLTSAATAARTITLPDASGTICLQGSASCGFAVGTNFWQSVNPGTITPSITSNDLLLGGVSTASATFHIYGATALQGNTPVASISGNTSQSAFIIDNNGAGDLFTASKSGATKFVINNAGDVRLAGGQTIDTLTAGTLGIGTSTQGGLTLGRSGAATTVNGSSLTIGPTSWTATPTISGLITASAGLTVASGQSLTLTNVNSNNSVLYANTSGVVTAVGTTSTANLCLLSGLNSTAPSWGACDTSAGVNLWQQNLGTLSPKNTTVDLLIGGVSTDSASFHVFGASGSQATSPVASISGNTNKAALVIDNRGTGDLFTASSSGLNRFTINNNGNIQLSGGTNFLTTLNSAATAARTITLPDASGTICLQGSASCGFSVGTNFWQQVNPGTITPNITSNDLLLGGVSTASATFHVYGATALQGNTPVASIAGNTSQSALILDNKGSGDIFTASSSGLNRFVIKQNGRVGIGTADPLAMLQLHASSGNNQLLFSDASTGAGSGGYIGQLGGNEFYLINQMNADLYLGTNNTARMTINGSGSVGIGTTSPLATLDVRGVNATSPIASFSALTNVAGLVVDNSKGDLFTASSSGLTRFVITNTGNVGIGLVGGPNAITAIGAGQPNLGVYDSRDNKYLTEFQNMSSTGNGAYIYVNNNNANNQALNIQSVGREVLHVFSNGSMVLGATSALGTLDVRGNSATTSIASFSGSTNFATAVVDNSGNGDIFTASSSGLSRFTIKQNGGIVINGFTGTTVSSASCVTTNNGIVIGSAACDLGNASWAANSGAVYLGNATQDLLLGGVATSSATFHVYGATALQGNTPVASISGNTSQSAFIIDNKGAGDLFTASTSGRSRFVINNNGYLQFSGGTNFLTTLISAATANRTITFPDASGTICISGQTCATSGTLGYWQRTNGALNPNFLGDDLLIGGAATSSATFHVYGATALQGNTPVASIAGVTSQAALITDNRGAGDLITASASGNIRFVINNNGNIQLSGGTNFLTTLTSAATAARTLTLPDASGTICISGQNCATSGTLGYWQRTNGALNPTFIGDDLLLGGSATSSATFHVYGATALQGNTPVASIAGVTSQAALIVDNRGNGDLFTASASGLNRFVIKNDGKVGIGTTLPTALLDVAGTASIASSLTFRSGAGAIQTTNNNTLTLGGNTTGDIFFDLTGAKRIGINTTTPIAATLDIRGTNATLPIASMSALTNAAGLVIDNSKGDIFTASASGQSRLTVQNNGNVILGSNTIAGALQTLNGNTLNLGTGGTGAINLGTDAVARIITAGNSTGATSLVFNSGTGPQSFTSLNATGTTTSSSYAFNATGLTTGTGLYLVGNSITSGTLASITSNSTAMTSGALATFDWSPSNAATTSGDVVSINIGSNADVTGEIFDVSDTNSSLFSVDESLITSALPAEFTAAGDVSIAYDLQFTNQSASYIKSNASLYLEAGESFESNDLTLRTFNSGNIIVDQSSTGTFMVGTTGTPQAAFQVDGKQTGKALVMFNETGGQHIMTASSSGTTQFVMANNGNINIGTQSAATTPFKLYVSNYQPATASAMIENTAANGGTRCPGNALATSTGCHTGLIVKLGQPGNSSTTFPTQNDHFVAFLQGNGKRIGQISGNVGQNALLYGTTGADYAEYFSVDPSVLPANYTEEDKNAVFPFGTLVCQGENGVIPCATADAQGLLGVISDTSGFQGGEEGPNKVLVGLVGQIGLKVSTANGPIKYGDPLTSSSVPGIAVKATNEGEIIGRALESYNNPDPTAIQRINTHVSRTWHDPSVYLSQNGNISIVPDENSTEGKFKISSPIGDMKKVGIFSDADIANLSAGYIDAKKLKIDGKDIMDLLAGSTASSAASSNALPQDIQALPASVAALTDKVSSLKAEGQATQNNLTSLTNKVASLEASLSLQASQSAFLTDMLNNNPLFGFQASSSAELGLDKLDVNKVTVTGTLDVVGRATFEDVGITGKVNLGLMSITGMDDDGYAVINTSTKPLKLQSHGLYGLDILDGKVKIAQNGDITTEGAITAKTVNTLKLNVAADTTSSPSAILSTSAGTILIPAGQTSIDVNTTALTPKSLIFATPDQAIGIGAKAKDSNTFTIKLPQAQLTNLKVNWWIVN